MKYVLRFRHGMTKLFSQLDVISTYAICDTVYLPENAVTIIVSLITLDREQWMKISIH